MRVFQPRTNPIAGGGAEGAGVGLQAGLNTIAGIQQIQGRQIQQAREQQFLALSQMEVAERQRMNRETEANRVAAREAIEQGVSPEGMYYDNIIQHLSPQEDAMLRGWIRDPNVSPEFIQTQVGKWGEMQKLAEAKEEREEMMGILGAIGSVDEGYGEQAAEIARQVEEEEISQDEGMIRATELNRQVSLEQHAKREQQRYQDAAKVLLEKYPISEMVMMDPSIRSAIEEKLTELNSPQVMVRERDAMGNFRMRPKQYSDILAEMEVLVRPDLQAAVDRIGRQQQYIQQGMQDRNPDVYAELAAESGGGPPFMGTVSPEAFDRRTEELYARQAPQMPQAIQGEAEPVEMPPQEKPVTMETVQEVEEATPGTEHKRQLTRQLKSAAAKVNKFIQSSDLPVDPEVAIEAILDFARQNGIEVESDQELIELLRQAGATEVEEAPPAAYGVREKNPGSGGIRN